MSFLNAITAKKNDLKATQTIVTHINGRKYVQTKDNIIELSGNFNGFVVDTKPDDVPAKVLDFIFMGSQDCCDLTVLEKYNIEYVLSVGVEAPQKYPHKQYAFVECLDVPETDITDVLKACNEFITLAIVNNCNVLVHCNAGVSRSSTVIIGYLILKLGYSYNDAYNAVKNVRPCIRPNDGFIHQLKKIS